jgi:hypothetical protein
VSLASAGAAAGAHVLGSPYAITPSAATGGTFTPTDYAISYVNAPAGFTVNTAALGITANDQSKTYGSTFLFNGSEFTSSGLQNSETVGSVSLASAGAAAGAHVLGSPYAITPSAATGGTFTPTDYAISYVNSALVVNPASLGIAANSTTRVYGNANPAFSATYTGFQNGETAAALGGTLAYATPAIPGSNVGNYVIAPSGQHSADYTITFVGGTLGVTPASLMVSADAKTKAFGTSDPALTFGTTGLVNNPALGVVDTAATVLSGALTRDSGETVLGGPYAITQGSLAANSNYRLGFTGNLLTITDAAAPPVVIADPVLNIFAGVVNNQTYYRPGNFWHIALNPDNADPGFDVMRGTDDANAALPSDGSAQSSGSVGRSSQRRNSCDSVFAGGFCETWSFPQQHKKVDKK